MTMRYLIDYETKQAPSTIHLESQQTSGSVMMQHNGVQKVLNCSKLLVTIECNPTASILRM